MHQTLSDMPSDSLSVLARPVLTDAEYELITQLRSRKPAQQIAPPARSLGERLADRVAATMGSWRFIIIQSGILTLWIILNATAYTQRWDPYPFILLNLMLSFQAAYAAPIIMMSQNRQAMIDRQDARYDYDVNIKAELEIELLHEQIHRLRSEELAKITRVLERQQQTLNQLLTLISPQTPE